MGELISDEILDTFAVQDQAPKKIAEQVLNRFGDVIDRTSCAYMQSNPEREQELIEAFRAA